MTSIPMFNLNEVTDADLKSAYVDRFCIRPGDTIIKSSANAAGYVTEYLRSLLVTQATHESFIAVFLDGQNRVIESRILFQGTLTQAAVYPREVVRACIELNAVAVIIAHNHPSGSLSPSAEDQAVTRKIRDALDTVDIKILDHIIIGFAQKDEYYSWADHGLLP